VLPVLPQDHDHAHQVSLLDHCPNPIPL
jgi:hypothetical protein